MNVLKLRSQSLWLPLLMLPFYQLPAQEYGSISGTIQPLAAQVEQSSVTRYTGQQIVPPDHHSGMASPHRSQAVVYLIPEEKTAVKPILPNPKIEQRDLQFQPRVLPVTVGTSVDFPNSDPVFHNVFSYSRAKTFDLGRYREGRSESVEFDKPGLIKVFCEIHNSMQAFVLVLDTPYFTVSNESRGYMLDSIPAGNYELVVWQEGVPETRKSIHIIAGEMLELDL